MSVNDSPVTSGQVVDYLEKNPEFFNDHLQLLESMTIPHPSGNAISLISKQLEIFRSKHYELEDQLNTLIEIARTNDSSFTRMHKLTLAMLDAQTLEQAVENLEHVIIEFFNTDFVTLRIISDDDDSAIDNLFVSPDDERLSHFSRELDSNQPKCGMPSPAQARFLFGDAAWEVKSCAIIPMSYTQLEGILAIGSRDPDRFHYSMGNLFLIQMSEIIGTRLISLCQAN